MCRTSSRVTHRKFASPFRGEDTRAKAYAVFLEAEAKRYSWQDSTVSWCLAARWCLGRRDMAAGFSLFGLNINSRFGSNGEFADGEY